MFSYAILVQNKSHVSSDKKCEELDNLSKSRMPERGSTPLELFWKLAEKNDGVRVDAAIKLVSHLQRLKVKESEAEDFEKSLKYCLNRLVTGLASDRAHSRRGFFISLVEFLRVFGDKISVQDVFEVMEETLNDKGTKGVSKPNLEIEVKSKNSHCFTGGS